MLNERDNSWHSTKHYFILLYIMNINKQRLCKKAPFFTLLDVSHASIVMVLNVLLRCSNFLQCRIWNKPFIFQTLHSLRRRRWRSLHHHHLLLLIHFTIFHLFSKNKSFLSLNAESLSHFSQEKQMRKCYDCENVNKSLFHRSIYNVQVWNSEKESGKLPGNFCFLFLLFSGKRKINRDPTSGEVSVEWIKNLKTLL